MLQRLQHLSVMNVSRRKFRRMNNRLPLRLHADMPFGSEMPFVVLAGELISGSRSLRVFCLLTGAASKVASTIVPALSTSPWESK